MQRPLKGEYNPYFQNYIDLVPEGNYSELLTQNTEKVLSCFGNIPPDKQDHAYADGKWTVKEMLIHIIDIERVMSYRALVAARGDATTPLHSIDDHLYVKNANASKHTLESLLAEFKAVRAATEKLFENISEEQSKFQANAVNFPITASALGYIIIGHTEHHIKILRERYL